VLTLSRDRQYLRERLTHLIATRPKEDRRA
jgi:hypothetical protein